jgi:acyl-coenzyme A thioesterase PaaI-like protein
LPYSAGALAVSAGFIRERNGQGELDAPALTALLDSYWPALYSTLSAPRPMTTVSFAAQYLRQDRPLPTEEPLFFRAHVLAQHEGYCVELRELWSGSTLVALNQQTFAVLA